MDLLRKADNPALCAPSRDASSSKTQVRDLVSLGNKLMMFGIPHDYNLSVLPLRPTLRLAPLSVCRQNVFEPSRRTKYWTAQSACRCPSPPGTQSCSARRIPDSIVNEECHTDSVRLTWSIRNGNSLPSGAATVSRIEIPRTGCGLNGISNRKVTTLQVQ